jgi:SagB-type dehydrogenase family enzyme
MTFFISDLHKDLRRARGRGAIEGKNALRGTHKEYLRMERIVLPAPAELTTSLYSALFERSSELTGAVSASLSMQDIGTLCGLALGQRENSHRNYPSGGGLYPIETYVVVLKGEEVGRGMYHYNPSAHALEKLWGIPDEVDTKTLIQSSTTSDLSAIIIFSSVWDRSTTKYGDFGYITMETLLDLDNEREQVIQTVAVVKPKSGV